MKLSRKFLILASAALVAGLPSAQADVTVNYSSGAPAVLTGTALTATNLGAPGLLPQPTVVLVQGVTGPRHDPHEQALRVLIGPGGRGGKNRQLTQHRGFDDLDD